MSSPSPPRDAVGLDVLDEEHAQVFKRALRNILRTEVAEFTYAQILDGLPTEQSLSDSYVFMEGHPVYELKHEEICEGYLEKAREFRSRFDASSLCVDESVGNTLPQFPITSALSEHYAKYCSFIKGASGLSRHLARFQGIPSTAHRNGCCCLPPNSGLPV